MKNTNVNRANRPSNWTCWLGGKAIIIGTCLSLGGFSASGALLGGYVPVATGGSSTTSTTRDAYKPLDYGNEWAGVYGGFGAGVVDSAGVEKAYVKAGTTVEFLKQSLPLLDFNATALNDHGAMSASYRLKLGWYTVCSGSTACSMRWQFNRYRTLFSGSTMVMVGPVPVTLSGSLAGVAFTGYELKLELPGVAITGTAGGSICGGASAGIGTPLLSVGLQCDLALLNSWLDADVHVAPMEVSGYASLDCRPIEIDLDLAVKSLGETLYSLDLAHYEAGTLSFTLLRF